MKTTQKKINRPARPVTPTLTDIESLREQDLSGSYDWFKAIHENHRHHMVGEESTFGHRQTAHYAFFPPSDSEESEEESTITQCLPSKEVLDFDATEPNTMFLTPEAKNKFLDLKLGPALKGLLRAYSIEVFLGTNKDMMTSYRSRGFICKGEVVIPTTAKYYIFESNDRPKQCKMILSGLQSQANLTSQLLALKVAEIDINSINIYGDFSDINNAISRDIQAISHSLPQGKKLVIIAGNGGIFEEQLKEMPECNLNEKLSFQGNIVSLSFFPLKVSQGGIVGIINLDMPYGEVIQFMLKEMMMHLQCCSFFIAGAGGGILSDCKVNIGDYHVFRQSSGLTETITLSPECLLIPRGMNSEGKHAHVDSPLLETQRWLREKKEQGCTCTDVECFYIFRAIKEWNMENPDNIGLELKIA